MQDRFKFRYNNNNKIYDVLAIDFARSRGEIVSLDKKETLMCKINLNNLIQCTGLKDKNGKLIYEGDIVEVINCRGGNAVVEYNLECAKFILKGEKFAPSALQHIRKDFFEIIGNIYENPGLLGKGT